MSRSRCRRRPDVAGIRFRQPRRHDQCQGHSQHQGYGQRRGQYLFRKAIAVGTESDATFGGAQTGPNDKFMQDAVGNRLHEGRDEVLGPHGRPGVITIGDSRGEILNFLSGNYHPGGGMSSLHVRCVLKDVDNAACDTGPVIGKLENTLIIGVDMTMTDGLAPVDNKTTSSFDMSVVYQ
jgi:hypothetical protein